MRHLGHLLRPFAACAALVALSLLSAAACAATRVDLNRDWQFRADPRGAGEADGWITSIPSATQSVTVPHTWNIGTLHDYLGVAWYFRSFEVPPQSPGTHLELHFRLDAPRGSATGSCRQRVRGLVRALRPAIG
ncbi:MAG TPA: hypothetical protein VNO35_05935 [Steroidobacteraceae bacterium]|nr:hypothetical protein [Steroidobacteraceae bacterium]